MRKITKLEALVIEKTASERFVNMYSVFSAPSHLWMKKVCKVYRRNRKNSGFSQVSWTNIALTGKKT